MPTNKTVAKQASVEDYLAQIGAVTRREDCIALMDLLAGATKEPPTMWGSSIVGFGSYHYRYESGREGESCLVGFSSRKADISIYGLGISDASEELLARLGKYRAGKGCLYIKKLSDVDLNILRRLIADALTRKRVGQSSE